MKNWILRVSLVCLAFIPMISYGMEANHIKPKSKNKSYHGNYKAARDATPEQLEKYTVIRNALYELLDQKKISKSTFQKLCHFIESLKVFHQNNKIICKEFYVFKKAIHSFPKDKYPQVHPEMKDLFFEEKATFFYNTLLMAYEMALEHDSLIDLAQIMASSDGCLEKRISSLIRFIVSY